MQAATLPKQIPGFSYILLEKRGAKPGLREIDLQKPVSTFSFALSHAVGATGQTTIFWSKAPGPPAPKALSDRCTHV